jgi:regulator of nucleoside diphosphate kinase
MGRHVQPLEEVNVHITVRGKAVQLSDALRSHCTRRVERALARFAAHVEWAEVVLVDLNGPKGGPAQACNLSVALVDGSRVILQSRESDFYLAAGQAASRAGRLVARLTDRARTRRPVARRTPSRQASVVALDAAAHARDPGAVRRSITVTDSDERHLRELLRLYAGSRDNDFADALEAELTDACVVDASSVPANVVTMNSVVVYEDESTGIRSQVSLVYPNEAQAGAGRVSVLAPVGTALLGLAVGESIDWTMPDGRSRRFRVLAVPHQPEAAAARDVSSPPDLTA